MTMTRPSLGDSLTGSELRRWYWLRSELAALARTLGVNAAGAKAELTDRLAAALDHQPLPPRPPTRSTGRQLSEPLADNTVIPAGQRSSQAIRAYLTSRVGPGFRFDAAMRDFVTHGEGRTLGEAVEHCSPGRLAGRPAGPLGQLPADARTAPETAR